jgi:hypothetical protein
VVSGKGWLSQQIKVKIKVKGGMPPGGMIKKKKRKVLTRGTYHDSKATGSVSWV